MKSQPQNPEFRNNPENFHQYIHSQQLHDLNIDLVSFYNDFQQLCA